MLEGSFFLVNGNNPFMSTVISMQLPNKSASFAMKPTID